MRGQNRFSRFVQHVGFFAVFVVGIFAPASWADAPVASKAAYLHALATHRKITPQFAFIRQVAEEMGLRVWLLGGAAASYANYVKEKLAKDPDAEPTPVHLHDIYTFLQDIDLVVDGNAQQSWAFRTRIITEYPYWAKEKEIWEVMTLKTHKQGDNERGLIDNFDFLNQNTDTLSYGLIELTGDDESQIVKSAREFDRSSLNNSFFEDVYLGRNRYLAADNHAQTKFAREGKNPSLISVMRYLTKVTRYGYKIPEESWVALQKVTRSYLANPPELITYARGRLNTVVSQLILESADTERTLHLLLQLRLVPYLLEIGGDPKTTNTLAWLVMELLLGKFPKSFHRDQYAKESLEKVGNIPNGSILEGTNLYNGKRGALLLRKTDPRMQPYLAQAREVGKDKSLSLREKLLRISQISQAAKSLAVRAGVTMAPIGMFDKHDCRDVAAVTHVLLNEIGIDNYIAATRSHSFNLVNVEGRLVKVDGYFAKLEDTYTIDYFASVYQPEEALEDWKLQAETVGTILKMGPKVTTAFLSAGMSDALKELNQRISDQDRMKLNRTMAQESQKPAMTNLVAELKKVMQEPEYQLAIRPITHTQIVPAQACGPAVARMGQSIFGP